MQGTEEYVHERLDHLGIVAGICQEIGLAGWLDAQDPDRRQQVSVGTATVAMVLNGLGFIPTCVQCSCTNQVRKARRSAVSLRNVRISWRHFPPSTTIRHTTTKR